MGNKLLSTLPTLLSSVAIHDTLWSLSSSHPGHRLEDKVPIFIDVVVLLFIFGVVGFKILFGVLLVVNLGVEASDTTLSFSSCRCIFLDFLLEGGWSDVMWK